MPHLPPMTHTFFDKLLSCQWWCMRDIYASISGHWLTHWRWISAINRYTTHCNVWRWWKDESCNAIDSTAMIIHSLNFKRFRHPNSYCLFVHYCIIHWRGLWFNDSVQSICGLSGKLEARNRKHTNWIVACRILFQMNFIS